MIPRQSYISIINVCVYWRPGLPKYWLKFIENNNDDFEKIALCMPMRLAFAIRLHIRNSFNVGGEDRNVGDGFFFPGIEKVSTAEKARIVANPDQRDREAHNTTCLPCL